MNIIFVFDECYEFEIETAIELRDLTELFHICLASISCSIHVEDALGSGVTALVVGVTSRGGVALRFFMLKAREIRRSRRRVTTHHTFHLYNLHKRLLDCQPPDQPLPS